MHLHFSSFSSPGPTPKLRLDLQRLPLQNRQRYLPPYCRRLLLWNAPTMINVITAALSAPPNLGGHARNGPINLLTAIPGLRTTFPMPVLEITIIVATLISRLLRGATRQAPPVLVASCAVSRHALQLRVHHRCRVPSRASRPVLLPATSQVILPVLLPATFPPRYHRALPPVRHRTCHRKIRQHLTSRRRRIGPRMAKALASPAVVVRAAGPPPPAKDPSRRLAKERAERIAALLPRAPTRRRHTLLVREKAKQRFFVPASLNAKVQLATIEELCPPRFLFLYQFQ